MDRAIERQRIRPGKDLGRVLEEAQAIATGVGQRMTSVHLLLAMFTTKNPAEVLLNERRVDEDVLIERLPAGAKEASHLINTALEHAEQTASRCGAKRVNTLHALVGMLRTRECLAYDLLDQSLQATPGGPTCAVFRNQVMSILTGVLPRRLLAALEPESRAPRPTRRRRRQRKSEDWVVPRQTFVDSAPPSVVDDDDDDSLYTEARPLDAEEQHGLAGFLADPPSLPERTPPQSLEEELVGSYVGRSYVDDEGREYDSSIGSALQPAKRAKPLVSAAPTLLPTEYDLDPDRFPWLTSLGRNLTSLAVHGQLDPAVGRGTEIEQLVDVLGKRRANNPCLVGEPGVGKTAIAEGLAVKQVAGDDDIAPLLGKVIIELDMGRITAGTSLRGSFSERLQGLKKDVEKARGKVIVFIDEIHTLMGAGASSDAPQDAAGELKAALARGAFPCIGSTTLDEYRKFIEQDPALERRFVKVVVEEPEDKECIDILRGAAPLYEKHHDVRVTDDALCAAVQLSSRFVHDRRLPGKALDLLDLSMSRARRSNVRVVGREQVARVCADVARVPLERVMLEDASRFLEMEAELGKRIIGHKRVQARVAETIRRNYAGFSTKRPMGSFLFLGPSGTGKTELAKGLAEFLFGSESALIRFDMSEFQEGHSVSRLVGSPPGYVGHQEGGQLTEAVRKRPHAVVLLDEIEKAHTDILPLLLQILDEGRLTDSKGRTVTFRHAALVLTSNLGSDALGSKKKSLGFGAAQPNPSDDHDAAVESARSHFAPELWGRLEEKLVFSALSRPEAQQVAALLLRQSNDSLVVTRNISFGFDDAVTAYLLDQGGYDETLGARPMRQAIQRHVEGPIADAILKGAVHEGDRLFVAIENDRVALKRVTA